jgi:hypothetical protein
VRLLVTVEPAGAEYFFVPRDESDADPAKFGLIVHAAARRCDAIRRAAPPHLDHRLRPMSLSHHLFRGGVLVIGKDFHGTTRAPRP